MDIDELAKILLTKLDQSELVALVAILGDGYQPTLEGLAKLLANGVA